MYIGIMILSIGYKLLGLILQVGGLVVDLWGVGGG